MLWFMIIAMEYNSIFFIVFNIRKWKDKHACGTMLDVVTFPTQKLKSQWTAEGFDLHIYN